MRLRFLSTGFVLLLGLCQAFSQPSHQILAWLSDAETHALAGKTNPADKKQAESLFRLAMERYHAAMDSVFRTNRAPYDRLLLYAAAETDSSRQIFIQKHAVLWPPLQSLFTRQFFDDAYWHCVRLREIGTAELLRRHRNIIHNLGDEGCRCTGGNCQKHAHKDD